MSILNYISVVIQEEVKTIPTINMMKTDKMMLATLMTKNHTCAEAENRQEVADDNGGGTWEEWQ